MKKRKKKEISFREKVNYDFDKVIFATGGKSSPNLGSDGSLFQTFEKHKYTLVEMNPSLCPIMTKENTKLVEGVRSEVRIKIFDGNKMIHEEEGELLFKDKGISGIVVFNASHYINQTDLDVKIKDNTILNNTKFVKKGSSKIG